MTGITSILSHLITVGLLWVAIIVSVQIVKYAILKKTKLGNRAVRRVKINNICSLINLSITVTVVIIIVFIVLFLYNPTERSYEEMDRMGTITPEVTELTKGEIKTSNKEVMKSKSEEKEKEAEQDNVKAMDKAEELFNRYIDKESKDED